MGKIKRILDNEWTKIFVEKLLLAGAIVGMTFFFDNVLGYSTMKFAKRSRKKPLKNP